MKKGLLATLLTTLLTLVAVASSQYGYMDPYGGYGMDPYGVYGMDPMAGVDELLRQLEQQQRQLSESMYQSLAQDRARHDAQMAQMWQVVQSDLVNLVPAYRQRSGDYSTPDEAVTNQLLHYYCQLRQSAASSCQFAWQMLQDASSQAAMAASQAGYGGDPLQAALAQSYQLQAENMQMMAWMMYADAARSAETQQQLVDWYRQQTSDYATQDPQDAQVAMNYYCQYNEATRQDCVRAEEISRQSQQAIAQSNANFQANQAARQASFDSWLAGRREASAAFDAGVDSWRAGQAASDLAHSAWLNTVILGNAQYAPEGGSAEWMPFAPNQNEAYTSPDGRPMVFDQNSNTWYLVNPNGTYTPYYGVP